jgi:hypothetical protein
MVEARCRLAADVGGCSFCRVCSTQYVIELIGECNVVVRFCYVCANTLVFAANSFDAWTMLNLPPVGTPAAAVAVASAKIKAVPHGQA